MKHNILFCCSRTIRFLLFCCSELRCSSFQSAIGYLSLKESSKTKSLLTEFILVLDSTSACKLLETINFKVLHDFEMDINKPNLHSKKLILPQVGQRNFHFLERISLWFDERQGFVADNVVVEFVASNEKVSWTSTTGRLRIRINNNCL